MKALARILSFLPFAILAGVGGLALRVGPGDEGHAPPPELPPPLQLAPADPPAPAPRPEPPAGGALAGRLELPEQSPLGDPVAVRLEVRNTGEATLSGVVTWLPLPEGMRTPALARYLRFVTPRLAPGEVAEHHGQLIPTRPGTFSLEARFRSAEGVDARAGAAIRLPTAVLTVRLADGPSAHAPCVVVANVGAAPARDVILRLRGPGSEETRLWPQLEAGAEQLACFGEIPAPAGPAGWEVEVSARAADPARLALPSPTKVR